MKRPNKGSKRVVPQPGGEAFHEGDAGPLIYSMEMPPVKSRGRLIPADQVLTFDFDPIKSPVKYREYCEREGIPHPDRPAIPTAEEIAKLPADARKALGVRCAARVAPLVPQPAPTTLDPQTAAAILISAATVRTPLRRLLRCIRRDYDRLLLLAKQQKWTDDTPVPENALGPLWPKDLMLPWVKN